MTVRKRRGVYRLLVGKPEERRPLGRTRRMERIILKWILQKWDGGRTAGLDRSGSA
jgi:hypothetical protein